MHMQPPAHMTSYHPSEFTNPPGNMPMQAAAVAPAMFRRQMMYNRPNTFAPYRPAYEPQPWGGPPGPQPILHQPQRPEGIQNYHYQPAFPQQNPNVPREVIQAGTYRQTPEVGRQREAQPAPSTINTGGICNTGTVGTSEAIPGASRPGTAPGPPDAGNGKWADGPVTPVHVPEAERSKERHSSRLETQKTHLSTILKEAVEKAFTRGILEGHSRLFSEISRELCESKTIFGFPATLPEGKTTEEIVKIVFDSLGALFKRCPPVEDHPGVKLTRKWLESKLHLDAQRVLSSTNGAQPSRANSFATGIQTSDTETALQHTQATGDAKSPKRGNKDGTAKTPRSSGKSQGGKRNKRKSADFTILGEAAQYEYEGKRSTSYKCSDNQTRILSPEIAKELMQREQANNSTGTDSTTVTPSPHTNTNSKRKSVSNGGQASASKKIKTTHSSDQTTVTHAYSGASGIVNPLDLSLAPGNEKQIAGGEPVQGHKFQEYMDNLSQASSSNSLHTTAAGAKPDNVVVSPQQELQQKQMIAPGPNNETFSSLNVDDLFDWNLFEAEMGYDSIQQDESTEREPAPAPAQEKSDVTATAPEKQPTINSKEKRIKELIQMDKGLPFGLIEDFMIPKAGSIYGVVRDAVLRNDFTDQSHLLFDSECRKAAKAEYDTHVHEQLGVAATDVPEWDASVRNAEKRHNKMQRRIEEEKAAAERRREAEARLEAEKRKTDLEDQEIAAALTKAMEEPNTETIPVVDTQEPQPAATIANAPVVQDTAYVTENDPLFQDPGSVDATGLCHGAVGENNGNEVEDDFDFMARQQFEANELGDMAWLNEDIFS